MALCYICNIQQLTLTLTNPINGKVAKNVGCTYKATKIVLWLLNRALAEYWSAAKSVYHVAVLQLSAHMYYGKMMSHMSYNN